MSTSDRPRRIPERNPKDAPGDKAGTKSRGKAGGIAGRKVGDTARAARAPIFHATSDHEDSDTRAGVDHWFRSSDTVRSSFASGNKFDLKPITYSVIGEMAIFEGDIALGRADELEHIARSVQDPESLPLNGVAIVGDRFRWPGGVIPYEIVSSMPDPKRITDAIAHWNERTPIRLVPYASGNPEHANYIAFEEQDGCWSEVGMRGGRQVVSIGPNCGVGQAIHEIGHAVGLWHEHSRNDRDNYVNILWENVLEGREHNFTQRISDGDDIGDYDLRSIMHYPPLAFSKNGQPTIVARDGSEIGQRVGLSDLDLAAVRAMYPDAPTGPTTEPAIVPDRQTGSQVLGTLPAADIKRWVTSDWPIDATVVWSIVPSPVGSRVEWWVVTERQSETQIKYYIHVRNLGDNPATIEVRFVYF